MTTAANKNFQSQGKPHAISNRQKPKGRRLTLKQYKVAQRLALDEILRKAGA